MTNLKRCLATCHEYYSKVITLICICLYSLNYSYGQQEFYDTTFGTNGRVFYDLPVHGEFGSILKHGNSLFAFIYYPGQGTDFYYPTIIKYDANGTIDPSFNGTGIVTTEMQYSLWVFRDAFHGYLGVTNDDKLIAVTSANGYSEDLQYNFIGKFNMDGSLDTTFGENGYVASVFEYGLHNLEVKKLANDDLIITGSEIVNADGDANLVIAKFNNQGNLATDFGTSGLIKFAYNYNDKEPIDAHFHESENALYVAWYNKEGEGTTDGSFSKYDLSIPALDDGFGNNGSLIVNVNDTKKEIIHRFTVNEEGEIIAACIDHFSNFEGGSLIKYNNQQLIDTTFGNNGLITLSNDISLYTKKIYIIDNFIYVVGEVNYDSTQFIKRFHPDGTKDLNFGNDGTISRTNTGTNWVFDMIVDGNTVTTCGSSHIQSGFPDPCISRFLIDPSLEVRDFNKSSFGLYPNPAGNYVNIIHNSPIEEIEIYNTLGQLILKQKGQNERIDVSALQKGIYHLRVMDASKKEYSTKIIKS